MRLYKTTTTIILERQEQFFQLPTMDWDQLVNRDDLYSYLKQLSTLPSISTEQFDQLELLAPIGTQEIWAAGVTYYRSRTARMEESKEAGGGSFYDKVYHAERPELFLKSLAHRTVGQHGKVRIRKDSTWNVPEPELTLFVTSNAKIIGYTVGNDMSSRSIEGENPLYLPQAKTYDGSAALGPALYVPEGAIDLNTNIRMQIIRGGKSCYDASISIQQMKRKHDELVAFLFRECSFPTGCFLMTGTGLIPADDFTLAINDEVRISIDAIGTLINYVA